MLLRSTLMESHSNALNVFYNSVRLSPVLVGPLQGRFSFGIGLPKSTWLSAFFHFGFFWLLMQVTVLFEAPKSVARSSTLSVKMLSQGGGAPATPQVLTPEATPTAVLTSSSAAAEPSSAASTAAKVPNPADNPAGVFGGGSRRRAFSAGGDRVVTSAAQSHSAQEAERKLRDMHFAQQQIQIFLRHLSSVTHPEIRFGRCSLEKSVDCDLEDPATVAALTEFHKSLFERYSFVQKLEIQRTPNNWIIINLQLKP